MLFIFGYSYLKGSNIFENKRIFYVKYQNVEGLTVSAPVTINGFTVGKVNDISFLNAKGELLVTFVVTNSFAFSKQSVAKIYSEGLIGGKALALVPDYESNVLAVPGDTLQGGMQAGMLDAVADKLGPLEEKLSITLAGLDTVFMNVNKILDTSTKNNLRSAIENLDATMANFNSLSGDLKQIVAANEENLNTTLNNLAGISENFERFSDSLAQVNIAKMGSDLEALIANLDQIVAGIENNEGSIGKLLNDEGLYNNLENASKELELLLRDLKENPKRYMHFSVFGKKPKDYQEPTQNNE